MIYIAMLLNSLYSCIISQKDKQSLFTACILAFLWTVKDISTFHIFHIQLYYMLYFLDLSYWIYRKGLVRTRLVGLTGAGFNHAHTTRKASAPCVEAKLDKYIKAAKALILEEQNKIWQPRCFFPIKRTWCLWFSQIQILQNGKYNLIFFNGHRNKEYRVRVTDPLLEKSSSAFLSSQSYRQAGKQNECASKPTLIQGNPIEYLVPEGCPPSCPLPCVSLPASISASTSVTVPPDSTVLQLSDGDTEGLRGHTGLHARGHATASTIMPPDLLIRLLKELLLEHH